MSFVSKRKIISGLVLLVTGLAVTYFKGDIPPNLMSLMQVLYSAFVIGNGVEHFTNMKAAKNDVVKIDN